MRKRALTLAHPVPSVKDHHFRSGDKSQRPRTALLPGPDSEIANTSRSGAKATLASPFQDLRSVQWYRFERIERDKNRTSVSVYVTTDISVLKTVKNSRLMQIWKIDKILD